MTEYVFKEMIDYSPSETGFVVYESRDKIYNMLVPLDVIEKGFYKKDDIYLSAFEVGVLNCLCFSCKEPKHSISQYVEILLEKNYKYSEKLTQITFDSLQTSLPPEEKYNLKMFWML